MKIKLQEINPENRELVISTPGRICLFGEHQDYLGLPVIASAISLRIFIEGNYRKDSLVNISLPDVNSSEKFYLNGILNYKAERDYFKSAVNVLLHHGFNFSRGLQCRVHGQIPINAGTSSSSALIVGWVNFLAQMSDNTEELSPEVIARYAHSAEVIEFDEPGGMMDHYSTAIGGVIFLEFYPETRYKKFPGNLKTFVLGDSGEPKDTKLILSGVKNRILEVVKRLRVSYPDFSLHTVPLSTIGSFLKKIPEEQGRLLRGTIANRDITLEAKKEFEKLEINHSYVGHLLNKHQEILRDVLKISTDKIDRMIEASLNAGAAGAKINGSGGGGCMFAYAPENPEKVAEAIEKSGGKSYIITSDCGTRTEAAENV